MSGLLFAEPVSVLVGLGFPVRIKGVVAAETYLQHLDRARQDDLWLDALMACREVREGLRSAEAARRRFVAYAKRWDVLVEEDTSVVAGKARRIHVV